MRGGPAFRQTPWMYAAASDVLWFYFGYSSYFTLTDENAWSLGEAEKWLLAQASATLLR
jgi:hypothetical protein